MVKFSISVIVNLLRYEFLISTKNAFGFNKPANVFSFATKGAGKHVSNTGFFGQTENIHE